MLNEYRAKSMRQEGSLLQTWAKVINPQKKASNSFQESAELISIEFAPGSSQFNEPEVHDDLVQHSDQPNSSKDTLSSNTKPFTDRNHVQIKLQKEIDALNADISLDQERYRNGLLSEIQEKEFKGKKLKKIELETTLKRKIRDAERSKKSRLSKKARQDQAVEKYPSQS